MEEDIVKYFVDKKELEELINSGCNDNANISYSPEVIAKYTYDMIAKQYASDIMPKEVAEAHREGFIHCLSPNNDLIVMIDGIVQVMNIVEVVDSFNDIDIYVPSVNTKYNIVEWKKVINGSCTGFKPVVEVTFAKGRKIEVTNDHKFIKLNSNHKVTKNYDYTINDFKDGLVSRICLINKIPCVDSDFYDESALYGFFLGDGSFTGSKLQFHLVKEDKIKYIFNLGNKLDLNPYIRKYGKATVVIMDNPLLFRDKYSLPSFKLNYKGLLEGLINSDGYITQHGGKKNNYLEFDSTNKFIFNLYVVACLSVGINPSVNIYYRNGNRNNIFRCLSQGLLTDELLFSLNLRDNHKIVEGSFDKNVHELSQGTIKSIKDLGEMPVFNITVEDNHNFMAGTLGFIPVQNCHDMEYYALRPNCFNFDLRFFIRNGLTIDGKGIEGSVANPARSLEVLLNHLLQALMAGAQVFSGGLGIANFNTFLAPLCRGRSYYDIKQTIQGFIFNCNMSLVAKGSQCLFSSVGLDMSVPKHLKDSPAVTFEGETIGVYADYQREADMIFKAFLEVLNEKDASGQWHRFPNTLINIQSGDLDEYKGTCKVLHELGANNPTLYYTNQSNYVKSIMGALTSDTPVMTNEGFKYPNQLCIGDTVMTYAEDGSKEWNKIYNIIPKIAPDKVFKITCDNNYMFKVTNNHKLPTNEGIIKSEDLKVGMELYNYLDDFYSPTDDYYFEFIGMFLADGYIRKGENDYNKGRSAIEFHIKLDWKKEAIIDICDKCNYEYDVIPKKDGTVSIYVREYDLKDELYELYDSNGVKHFPNVWDNKNKVANIIKGLMLDASKQKNRFVWSCSDLPLVTDVLYALSMIGRENTLYVDNRSGDTGKWRTNYRITFGAKYKPKNKTKIKSIELVDNDDIVYDLSIENNANYVCGLGGIHSENCRTALPDNFTGVYDLDCLNTGNFAYTTLNLPLLALESDGDVDKFYELLDKYCDIARDGLLNRRELVKDVIYNKHMSDFLLQRDKVTGIPLYDIDRTTITLGFCGLYECMKILNYNFGEDIIQFINAKTKQYKLEDGLRWSVIASPAESANHRFAMIIKDKYPEVELNGTEGNYYLTNSSHIPVSHESDIVAHIRNADKYHPLTKGGNILHIWLGETYHDPIAIWKLNKKVLETNTNFWAFTNDFTYCNDCHNTFNEALDKCSVCGSNDLTIYSRITGYYVPVKNWNKGKKAEFDDRYRHRNI